MSAAAEWIRDGLGAAALDGESVYRYVAAGVTPACVAEPADAAELAAVVRAAAAQGLAIVPVGRGVDLALGHPPRRYDVALSTRRMGRVIAHEAADMTVTVEAGVTLAGLAQTLAGAGQWLPLDPARAEAMTIGGLVAADRSGPLRYGYGKVRDWLIGVAVVTADGGLLRGGGRVVKNVAGYDLPKLFAGSFGTLGVIVEASFKVLPRPAATALFAWPARTLAGAYAQAAAVADAPVVPVLLDVVNEPAAESLGLDGGPCVVIGCDGSPAHLDEQARRCAAVSNDACVRIEAQRADALRKALSGFPQPANEDGVVVRISALPSALPAIVAAIERAAAAQRTVAEIAAHAGNGVAWCQLLGAPDDDILADLATAARAAADAHGAFAIFEFLPAALRGRLDPWGPVGEAVRIMRGVKRALDPGDMFSPGRFVDGL
jgi:glycolate oxidase FAD binding subunit